MIDPVGSTSLGQAANNIGAALSTKVTGGASSAASSGVSGGASAPEAAQAADFKAALMKHIDQVDQLQQGADKAIGDLAAGRRDEMANVMIAKTKADLAFGLLAQLRQQMDQVYQELERLSK